jgi:hypothetical protein
LEEILQGYRERKTIEAKEVKEDRDAKDIIKHL